MRIASPTCFIKGSSHIRNIHPGGIQWPVRNELLLNATASNCVKFVVLYWLERLYKLMLLRLKHAVINSNNPMI